jgi:hypothetical protein
MVAEESYRPEAEVLRGGPKPTLRIEGRGYFRGVKRIARLFIFALVLALLATPVAWSIGSVGIQSRADRSPGAPIAHAITTVTGVAISPLLATSALGAFQWIEADSPAARAALPWYAQPKFWIPALLIVAVCAAKDTFGVAVPPVLKKPLDALEVAENKFSGLIAAGAVIPIAMNEFSKLLVEQSAGAPAPMPAGLAMIPVLGVNWAPALDILTIPFGIAVFAVVWMASHAINVLILLSPWGAIDAALKSMRTALLGLLALTATIHPWLGALLSIVVIVFAYFVAGWSFRLTVFGAIVCWDFFTGRRGRFTPTGNANRMFSGSATAVPVRTYGRLVRRADGGLEFAYRPWLVRPERVVAVNAPPPTLAIGRGLFWSTIVSDAVGTLFLLPPRYRGHEEALVRMYAFGGGVRPAGLRKAWTSLKELIGGRSAEPAPATVVP